MMPIYLGIIIGIVCFLLGAVLMLLIPLLMSYVNSFLVHFFLGIAFLNFNSFQEKNKQIKKIN